MIGVQVRLGKCVPGCLCRGVLCVRNHVWSEPVESDE